MIRQLFSQFKKHVQLYEERMRRRASDWPKVRGDKQARRLLRRKRRLGLK